MYTIQEIKDILSLLQVEISHETEDYIVVKGINGNKETISFKQSKTSTMLEVSAHLRQMGRDSLKMDLDNLLNTTKHN